MTKWIVRLAAQGMLIMMSTVCLCSAAYAETLQSPSYKFDESVLGGGGLVQSNSANYQSTESIGDTAIGNSASSSFQIEAGHTTTSEPTLTFAVNNADSNFGSFSASGASVATASFSVSNYTSYGYVVQIIGNPPTNGSHTIAPMTTTGPSQAGEEQFGINLVANTSPSSFGANPVQGLFGAGTASASYGTPNVYRYVDGETIAMAPKSSGVTTYTISQLVNVDPLTPGGQYKGHEVLVCTGTY